MDFIPTRLIVPTQTTFKTLCIGLHVHHDQLGNGMIVGFSSMSSHPFVFFYGQREQERWNYAPACVGAEELKNGWVGD